MKKISKILAVLALSSCMVACGDNGEMPDEKSTTGQLENSESITDGDTKDDSGENETKNEEASGEGEKTDSDKEQLDSTINSTKGKLEKLDLVFEKTKIMEGKGCSAYVTNYEILESGECKLTVHLENKTGKKGYTFEIENVKVNDVKCKYTSSHKIEPGKSVDDYIIITAEEFKDKAGKWDTTVDITVNVKDYDSKIHNVGGGREILHPYGQIFTDEHIEITSDETTIIDNDIVKIRVLEFCHNNFEDCTLKVEIENKTDELYRIKCEKIAINGVAINENFWLDKEILISLNGGEKKVYNCHFEDKIFEETYGINRYTDVQLIFECKDDVENSEEYREGLVNDSAPVVHIYPYGKEQAHKENVKQLIGGSVIYEDKLCTVVMNGDKGYFEFLCLNKTDEVLDFYFMNVYIDGKKVDMMGLDPSVYPYVSINTPAGIMGYQDFVLCSSKIKFELSIGIKEGLLSDFKEYASKKFELSVKDN